PKSSLPIGLMALFSACGNAPPPSASTPSTTNTSANSLPATPTSSDPRPYAIDRAAFNEVAFRLNIPAYWSADKNGDGAIDPDEVASLLFFPTDARWIDGAKFTPDFDKALAEIKAAMTAPPPGDERLKLARDELAQGATTLVYSDLRGLSAEEKTL